MKEKKFDLAIMNPPYDDGSKGMGHIDQKIILKVATIAEETIAIDMGGWVENRLAKFRNKDNESCFDYIKDITIIDKDEFNKMFNIGASQDGVILKLDSEKKTWYDDNFDKNNPIYKIIDKIDTDLASASRKNRGKSKVYIKRKSFSNNDKWLFKEEDIDINNRQYDYNIGFDNFEERENFLLSFETLFMKFVLKEVRPGRIIRLTAIPFMQDYSQPWTNERFCKYFDITGFISDTEAEPGSEWEEILKTMEKYK